MISESVIGTIFYALTLQYLDNPTATGWISLAFGLQMLLVCFASLPAACIQIGWYMNIVMLLKLITIDPNVYISTTIKLLCALYLFNSNNFTIRIGSAPDVQLACFVAYIYSSAICVWLLVRDDYHTKLWKKRFSNIDSLRDAAWYLIKSGASATVNDYVDRVCCLQVLQHFVPLYVAIPMQSVLWRKLLINRADRMSQSYLNLLTLFLGSISVFAWIENGWLSAWLLVTFATVAL